MKKIISVILLFFCFFGILYTQSPPCLPDAHGLSFKIVDNQKSLPLSIHMPLDVIQSYIILDSIMYNITYNEFNYYLDRQSGYSESIKILLKHFLVNYDYDPIRFYLFLIWRDINKKYGGLLIKRDLNKKLEEVSPDYFFDYMALYSPIIMHVKVDDILVRNDPFFEDSVLIATCSINDTISGRIIPTCKNLAIPNTPEDYYDPLPRNKLAKPGECIQFNYGFHYLDVRNWLKKSSEYIVFLSISHICFDSNDVYYNLSPRFNYSESYGMYPVVDGKVIDPANELKLGVETDVEEFKKGLRERLGKIKNFEPLDVIEEIPEFISENEIKSFPNPFSGETSLVFNIPEPGSRVELNIYNQMGNKVYSERFISDTHGTNIKTISLDGQPSGAYYCTISTRNGYAGGKLLLIK